MAAPPRPSYNAKLYDKLRGEIRIDPMKLSEELMESADLVMTAAENCASALALRDMRASDVKVTQARRASKLRSRVTAGKARSETEIKSLLEGDEEVIAAQDLYEAARLDAALWTALVDATRLKHSALKRVAELTVSGYLTTTSVVASRRKEINEVRKRRREEHDGDDD